MKHGRRQLELSAMGLLKWHQNLILKMKHLDGMTKACCPLENKSN
jgi:hypothetical protein